MLAVALPVAAIAFGVIWWATLKINFAPPSVVRKPQEVSIGKFSCRNSALGQSAGTTPTTAAVDCSISAVIEAGEVELLEMEDRLDQYRARLREVVEISIRHASVEETQDPDLTAMRQRLQEGFNSLLGDKAVKEVVINNWRAYTIPIFAP